MFVFERGCDVVDVYRILAVMLHVIPLYQQLAMKLANIVMTLKTVIIKML